MDRPVHCAQRAPSPLPSGCLPFWISTLWWKIMARVDVMLDVMVSRISTGTGRREAHHHLPSRPGDHKPPARRWLTLNRFVGISSCIVALRRAGGRKGIAALRRFFAAATFPISLRRVQLAEAVVRRAVLVGGYHSQSDAQRAAQSSSSAAHALPTDSIHRIFHM